MLATSAIAAALACNSPALAQDAGTATQAQPVTVTPTPAPAVPTTTTVTTPPATVDTAPPATDTTTQATTTAKPATAKRATGSASAAAAARRAQAQSLARTLAARSATRKAATAAPSAAPAPAPAPATAAATPPAPPPPAAAAAPAPKPAAAEPANGIDERTLELGGGALALLALGGGAYALMRRRRHDEDEWIEDETAYHGEPVREPLELDEPAAPMAAAVPAGLVAASPRHDPVAESRSGVLAPPMSAFGWSANAPRHDAATPADPAMDGDDRRPGESWMDRARRGPSSSNPSLSLKKRLKRAAFFDQRERAVAEGKATPVDADAGLPEASQDELEHA